MKAAEHFKAASEFHKSAAKEHAALAEECGEQGYDKMAECHKSLSELHAGHAEHFKCMASDATEKSFADEMAKARAELQPSRVSGVAPLNPLRAVIRPGQPEIAKVDEEFQDLVKIDGGNED